MNLKINRQFSFFIIAIIILITLFVISIPKVINNPDSTDSLFWFSLFVIAVGAFAFMVANSLSEVLKQIEIPDKEKELYKGLSIAKIMVAKKIQSNKIINIILLIPTFMFACLRILNYQPSVLYIIIPITLILLLDSQMIIVMYRIKKGYFGSNINEMKEIINFIVKNSQKIDFTDDNGNYRKLIDEKDLAEILEEIKNPVGVQI